MKPLLGAVVVGVIVLAACGNEDSISEVAEAPVTNESELSEVGPTVAEPPVTTAPADIARSTTAPVSTTVADCADVAPLTTDVLGTLGPAPNPDPLYLGVIATYAADHADVSGGFWIDRDSGGTIVLAVTDDPGPHIVELGSRSPQPNDVAMMEPRPEIIDHRSLSERDETFDVVHADFTEAEMNAAVPAVMGALQAAGFNDVGAGASITVNRISVLSSGSIATSDLPAVGAALAGVVPLEMVCVDGVVDELPPTIEPDTPLQAIVLPDAEGSFPPETRVTCGGIGFTLGELKAMRPLATAGLDGLSEAVAATVEGLGAGSMIDLSTAQVIQDDGLVVNVMSFTDTGYDAQGWFERTSNGWTFAGGGTGATCDLRLLPPEGMGLVDWVIDPAYPYPSATDTEIHALVTEQACTGGSEMGERLLGPEVVMSADAVRIAFAAVSLQGDQACPGNPSTPVTVKLPEPLGTRTVLDGLLLGPPGSFID